jgi:hypothetical protein
MRKHYVVAGRYNIRHLTWVLMGALPLYPGRQLPDP